MPRNRAAFAAAAAAAANPAPDRVRRRALECGPQARREGQGAERAATLAIDSGLRYLSTDAFG
jgi:hypothetical protein